MKLKQLSEENQNSTSVFDEHFSEQDILDLIEKISDKPERMVLWHSHYEADKGNIEEKLPLKTALLNSLNNAAANALLSDEIENKTAPSEIQKDMKIIVKSCERILEKINRNGKTHEGLPILSRLKSHAGAIGEAYEIDGKQYCGYEHIFPDLPPSDYLMDGNSYIDWRGNSAVDRIIQCISLLKALSNGVSKKTGIYIQNTKGNPTHKGKIAHQKITDSLCDIWENLLGKDINQQTIPTDGTGGVQGPIIDFFLFVFSRLNLQGDSEAIRAHIRRRQETRKTAKQIKN